jgi:preprotein translocase subunit SecE
VAKKDKAAGKSETTKKADAADKANGSKASAKAQESQGNSVITFLRGTKEELDKVVWPSRQQLISESIAVIFMVALSAAVIYLVDQLFGWAAQQVF